MAKAKPVLTVDAKLMKRASEFLDAVQAVEGVWFHSGQIVALGAFSHGRYAMEEINHPSFFMESTVYDKMVRLADEITFFDKGDGVIECRAGKSKATLKPKEMPTKRVSAAAALQIPQEAITLNPVQTKTMYEFAESKKSATVTYLGGWMLATDSVSMGACYIGEGQKNCAIPAILFKKFDEFMLMHMGETVMVSCDKRGVLESTTKEVMPSMYSAVRLLNTEGETPSAVVWRSSVVETLRSFSGAEDGEVFLKSDGEACLKMTVNFKHSEIEDALGANIYKPVDVVVNLDSILSYFKALPDDAYVAITEGANFVRLQSNSNTIQNLPMAVMSKRAQ